MQTTRFAGAPATTTRRFVNAGVKLTPPSSRLSRFRAAAAPLSISFQNGKPYLAVGNNPPVPLEVAAKGGLALSESEELKDVAALFDMWNAALQTGDPVRVASLYAPDGILLPTVSNKVRDNFEAKVDYFTHFLKLKPFGTIDESHVRFLNAKRTVAINSGIYTFDLVKNGKPTKVQARYSFGYKKIDGVWKIVEHHSSAMPEVTADPLQEVAEQFNIWNAALQTGDPEKVASLYAPDGILLPTVSNKVRTDHASKVDYFTHFLKLKPFGTINESYVRFLSPAQDMAVNSGIYTFDLVKEGKPTKVQARYSFAYRKIEGAWKIVEHHSSAMPEPIADPLKEVAEQFNIWNAALQTGDPEKVASLYAPDGILLPTVSNRVRADHASKVDYFAHFLQLRPYGTIDESHVRFVNNEQTLAVNSGIYTFDLVKEGKPTKVQARYSFAYRKIEGAWKIVEHHSSAMPEPTTPSASTPAPAAPKPEAVAAPPAPAPVAASAPAPVAAPKPSAAEEEKELVTASVAAAAPAAAEPAPAAAPAAAEPPKKRKGFFGLL